MKKLLYVLTGALLLAGLWTGCEDKLKEPDAPTGGGIPAPSPSPTPTEQWASIQGTVTDKETKAPLSGVTIELQPVGKQVQTAEDGTYRFDSLNADTYILTAQKDGYDDYENEKIQLEVAQTLTLDIAMMESTPCVLQGKVTDKETGDPLANVMIEIQPTGKQGQTAEDGTYLLNLKAGIYTLKARKAGYVDYTKEEIQLTAEQSLQLDIEMEEDEYQPGFDYTVTTYGLNMEMVYVEGGTFERGATAEQVREWGIYVYENERPVKEITLDSYHIGKYEVTQAQWRAVMGTDAGDYSYYDGRGDNYPVYYVSWDDAQEFCKKLSAATGKQYVLPTEAQWEYAARGGNKIQHYAYAGSNDFQEVTWCVVGNNIYNLSTHPVGTKKANELGIYDMSGNVSEWCSDWYGKDYYSSSPAVNPQGPASGFCRVARGGSFRRQASPGCRVAVRAYAYPDAVGTEIGFRVACLP